ncbi:5910_t:CDS:2 [Diversispora eburnea]|uniref:5910_t:CDS:1 n=2 Tax=Diversisporales TaxID=214509 RepID=A0A9N8Z680_9GLOM|nr:5910_t:CDS:2 [Diversispora eburnea]
MGMTNIQGIARLVFILCVIFLSIYFILPPSAEESLHIEKTLKEKIIKQSLQKEQQAQQHREALDKQLDKLLVDKRTRADKDAIGTTKRVIKEKLKFDFTNYIPGSNSFGKINKNGNNNNVKRLKEFKRKLDCMTSKEWQFVRESVKYVWKTPEECPMPKFNIEKACSIIYGKKFLLVGDILLFQLHELLLDYFKEGSVQCYGEIACKEHLLCKIDNIEQGNGKQKQPPKMKFIRNDLISNRQNLPIDDIKFTDAKNLELPWISYAHKFNVLILNKGHHWQDDETFRNNLIEVMDSVRTKFPNTLIIYKSTTLGHLNCQSAKEPLSSPPNATELESLPYHWGEIHRQNLIAKEIIEAVGGVFIDLENVMITRIDDHIGGQDCLRWCIPGPADIWLDFLFYVMNELK